MRRFTIIVSLAVSIIVITSAFIVSDIMRNKLTQIESSEKNGSNLANITSFDDAVNDFAFKFYKEIYKDPNNKGNIFISPYSIFTALAMTYEGAKGVTAEEMRSVLNIEQDNESFHEYVNKLYKSFNDDKDYNISTANALWPRVGYELLQDYVNVIQTYYGGEVNEVDYSNPTEASAIINGWVENKTNRLIKNLVPADAIDPMLTVLILTNAIYFKGLWELRFDLENTTDRKFITSSKEIIDVPTMQLVNVNRSFNYTETNEMQVLELPYRGNEISMIVLLPKEGYELIDIINSIDRENYSELINSMNERDVDIYLPKFEIKTPLYDLNHYLMNLGMKSAFAPSADFSGINGVGKIYIDKVLHKAYVKVNEEGTEAAAATAVIMMKTSLDENQRIEFNCNRPFMFIIKHKETNTILFMGNVNNPLEAD